jgi:hypothetical protein
MLIPMPQTKNSYPTKRLQFLLHLLLLLLLMAMTVWTATALLKPMLDIYLNLLQAKNIHHIAITMLAHPQGKAYPLSIPATYGLPLNSTLAYRVRIRGSGGCGSKLSGVTSCTPASWTDEGFPGNVFEGLALWLAGPAMSATRCPLRPVIDSVRLASMLPEGGPDRF